jgi:signal transduction histidine kinase
MFSGKMFRYLFVSVAVLIAIASVLINNQLTMKSVLETNRLTDVLKEEERKKIELWAETIGVITSQALSNEEYLMSLDKPNYKGVKQFIDNAFINYDTLLTTRIVEGNHTIPVIMTDETGEVVTCRNVLPYNLENFPSDSTSEDYDFYSILQENRDFLKQKVKEFAQKHEPVEIKLDEGIVQHVYYDDSTTLKQLQLFPYSLRNQLQLFLYIQLGVVFIFILVSFVALNSTKKAEQNRVWVGLSKETAHQLGTPISSLMAWLEYLKNKDLEPELLTEIDKDVDRLKTIAERFSKIGSSAKPEPMNLEYGVNKAIEYLSRRISSKVNIQTDFPKEQIQVLMNESLFGWVIENLVKNAVDAMNGQGTIQISAVKKRKMVLLNVTDTGKGIPKSKFDVVFRPGYTTKQRGWGLGLSLVKRIIESYHKGKIYVYKSEIDKGTTFRIVLKAI